MINIKIYQWAILHPWAPGIHCAFHRQASQSTLIRPVLSSPVWMLPPHWAAQASPLALVYGVLCSPALATAGGGSLSPAVLEIMGKGVSSIVLHMFAELTEPRGPALQEGSGSGGRGVGVSWAFAELETINKEPYVWQRRPQTDTQGSSWYRKASFAWFPHKFECWNQEVVTPHVYNVK